MYIAAVFCTLRFSVSVSRRAVFPAIGNNQFASVNQNFFKAFVFQIDRHPAPVLLIAQFLFPQPVSVRQGIKPRIGKCPLGFDFRLKISFQIPKLKIPAAVKADRHIALVMLV